MDSLPPEIFSHILIYMDMDSILNVSTTCSFYKYICSDNNDYIWKILTHNILNGLVNHKTIQDFNEYNRTSFCNWHELCTYICKLAINPWRLLYHSCEGHVDIVNYIYKSLICGKYDEYDEEDPSRTEYGIPDDKKIEYSVVYGDDYDEYKHDMNKVMEKCLECSSRYGRLNLFKYIHRLHPTIFENQYIQTIANASIYGHLNIIHYCIENVHSNNMIFDLCFMLAAHGGHIDILKYIPLDSISHNIKQQVLIKSTQAGQSDVIEYLQGRKV